MSDTLEQIICKPSITDIFSLPFLFDQAVTTDFSFYNDQVKKRIIKKNSLRRLFFARLRKQRTIFVAKVGGKCVGLIIASHNASIGIVHWLFVLSDYRKQKIGSNLLKKVESELASLGCHKITLTTEVAPEFYKSLGYTQEGLLKKHWWGKDFTVLSKNLGNT
ncbi:MAG: GNAT family N-acetyltransferase [Candidatus Magasanikbacteria bacterium]|nr:GNAT family N-acetyltransferase [Candidatus Magasanikbacteria bacterium]